MHGPLDNSPFTRNHPAGRRQGGIATILIMLMVGVSLTVAVLGVTQYIRVSQDKLLTVHTQTQAQLRAWTGVEAVREYLVALKNNNKLVTLAEQVSSSGSTGTPLSITGLSGVNAKFIAVDSATDPKQFTADISGTSAQDTQGQGSSTVRVVFGLVGEDVIPSPSPARPPPKNGVINFDRNLRMGGEITVESEESNAAGITINVNGDISTSGNSITGVAILNSTGSVSLDSGSSFKEIHANCDVRLTGAVTSATINARRHVCLESGSSAGTTAINANGSVIVTSSGTQGAIAAMGMPTDVGSCRPSGSAADNANSLAQTCNEPNASYVVDFQSYGTAKSVKSKGSVHLGGQKVGDVQAEGDIYHKWGGKVDSGAITGQVRGDNPSDVHVSTGQTGLTVTLVSVSRVVLTTEVVDAYDYLAVANYVFTVDSNGYKKVKVHNVSGIADDTYYIGKFNVTNNDKVDYLCTKLDAGSSSGSPLCDTSQLSTSKTICQGFSAQNTCFSYDSSKKKWSIDGKSIAQGVAWFDGDLNVGSGIYYNTFVATQNITTSGSDKVYAPNFAGYTGTVAGETYAPTGICVNSSFPTLYPKQFCDTSTSTYLQDADGGIGNFAFIAGSVKNGKYTGPSSYIGGNVSTGASTELFGSVKAGNEFTSSGETIIHGYVTALAAGVNVNNSLGAKTVFKLKKLPDTFKPGGGSGGDGSGSGNGGGGAGAGGGGSTYAVKWARYL